MSSNLAPLFTRGINDHLQLRTKKYPTFYDKIFDVEEMDGRYEDYQLWETYGLAAEHKPLEAVPRGEFQPSFSSRVVVVDYALGDMISYYDWEDDQYGVIAKLLPKKGGALAESHILTREYVAANYLRTVVFATEGNNTLGTSDGRPIGSTSHPTSQSNSTTIANRPAVDSDLSIATYQQARTGLSYQFAANGVEIINNSPKKVVIHPNNHYVAAQILKGEWEYGTADRNMNVIANESSGVQIVEDPYFRTSGSIGTFNAWMLLGEDHYFKFKNRQNAKVWTDWSINVLGYEFASASRFAIVVPDWRGSWINKGA
jgi:hypothetical protein